MSFSLNNIYWPSVPRGIEIPVSVELSGNNLLDAVKGKLYVSKQGYVYSAPSKSVTWCKFLGLAIGLPIQSCVAKCGSLFQRCCGNLVSEKGNHDIKHLCHLSGIAWKGVLGYGGKPLLERVEEFAFAEIDYNNIDREAELSLPRSKRLTEGTYKAVCIQPLFHQRDQAQRCHKYAAHAIFSQQSCCTSALMNIPVETPVDVKCCGFRCFRHQKVCGVLHKIDCCANRCWAIDCLGCFCCFWPEAHSWCILH